MGRIDIGVASMSCINRSGNDDARRRGLRLKRDPSDERTGHVHFRSGLDQRTPHRAVLYRRPTCRRKLRRCAETAQRGTAGSNSDVCDALSRNVPRLAAGTKILLANCLAHWRRQFVEVAENFAGERRYVLEMLGHLYSHDAEARDRGLTPEQRLQLHQEAQRSGDGRTARMARISSSVLRLLLSLRLAAREVLHLNAGRNRWHQSIVQRG
jgi:hypothetical protein